MSVLGSYQFYAQKAPLSRKFNSPPVTAMSFQDIAGWEKHPVAFNIFFLNNHRHIRQFASIVAPFCAAIAKKIAWKTTRHSMFSVCSASLWETGTALRQITQI